MAENSREHGANQADTILKALLREEFQAGVKDSKDPENAWLPDLAIRKTTMYSPWFMRLCPFCGLEFREGDLARICPECGQAYHDDPRYNLRCWRRYFSKHPFCSPEKRNRDGVPIRKKCEFRPDGDLMGDDALHDDGFGFCFGHASAERGREASWYAFQREALERAGDSATEIKTRPRDDSLRDDVLHDDVFASDLSEKGPSGGGTNNPKPGFAFLRLEKVEAQFMDGLEAAWKPFGDRQIVVVRETDPMVGMKCPWCRSFIRAGDRVVKCPCGKCETWFHMDVLRHLTCWNEWSGSKGHDFCPTTCARIEPESEPKVEPESEHEIDIEPEEPGAQEDSQ